MLNTKDLRKFRRESNSNDRKNKLAERTIRKWKIYYKFSKNLFEHGATNFMQGNYLGYIYSRWRKIRDLDKDDPLENTGQMQSSFKEFEKKIRWR
mgnify:CR=1 FL=1